MTRREEDLRLVGVEDDPAGVMDGNALARLRGKKLVPCDRGRELVRSINGDKGLLERAPVQELLSGDRVREMVEEAVVNDGPQDSPATSPTQSCKAKLLRSR
jgi:hypothetical protein